MLDEAGAASAGRGLARRPARPCRSVEQKPYTRRPYAPFMTSTLQQEAGRKLRFSSERTMSIAQRLYENGYITYMRTDSTTLSESAINAARKQASQLYGEEYVHPTPRQYTRKVKNAQEAHEAIRPAGDVVPDAGPAARAARQRRVPALRADLAAHGGLADGRCPRHDAVAAHHRAVRRLGRAGGVQRQRPHHHLRRLPARPTSRASTSRPAARPTTPRAGCRNLTQGQRVDATDLTADGHTTSPPARYTEASLIKALEELGIGRPSTYSSIIKTIQDRGYVHKKGSALVPSWVAFAVIGSAGAALRPAGRLRLHRGDGGRARRDRLRQRAKRTNWLNNFYFGGDHGVDGVDRARRRAEEAGRRQPRRDRRPRGQLHQAVRRRSGPRDQRPRRQNGPYLERMVIGDDGEPTPQRANLKDELTPDELTLELAEKAVLHTARGPLARRRPGDRARDRRQGRPLRPVRHRGAARAARRAGRRRAREEGQEARPARSRAPVRCCGRWTWRR